jgi:hypothetical protein
MAFAAYWELGVSIKTLQSFPLTFCDRILTMGPTKGAIAQLGERLTGSQEVTGSIPVSSTNKACKLDSSMQALFVFGKSRSNALNCYLHLLRGLS